MKHHVITSILYTLLALPSAHGNEPPTLDNVQKQMQEELDTAKIQYDTIRIELTNWHGMGAGLAEIEVIERNRNILRPAMINVSEEFDGRFLKSNLTDGIKNCNIQAKGYWLLPNEKTGWIEIKF